ncbi:hypothetical protein IJT93_01410 [bacterium]|nr:hypothetical protein [bacterium]
MLNTRRNTALVLALAFLLLLGFSAPSRADDPGAVAKTFFNKLVAGQSVWNMLTKQSQEIMIQMVMAQAKQEKSLEGVDAKEIEAFARQELANENGELSKSMWQEVKKELAGVGTITVKDVKVNGNTAVVTVNDGSTMNLYNEGGAWKVGLMESISQ